MTWWIGCAGWAIPQAAAARFPGAGSHLERYARVLPAVEVDSSFYRYHEPGTYARWAASVPAMFRFAVKLPREITHFHRLTHVAAPLRRFLTTVRPLGKKLGPLLVQLPPSLVFDARRAAAFFAGLRRRHRGPVACEPRHASWFDGAADASLSRFHVARVGADPACVPAAAEPGGWARLVYYRLHGSPRMYYSAYGDEYLRELAGDIRRRARGTAVWCIFDNTAVGAATQNALQLLDLLA